MVMGIGRNCRDPSGIRRAANHISWYADGARKLAVSYCNLQFQGGNNDSFIDSYIWDVGKAKTTRKKTFMRGLIISSRKSHKT